MAGKEVRLTGSGSQEKGVMLATASAVSGEVVLTVAISSSVSFDVGMRTICPRSYRDLRPKPGCTGYARGDAI